jgi:type I restriction enzyme R subunit
MPLPAARDSEWVTRKALIDTALRAAGWRITPFDQGKSLNAWNACAVEEYQTATGPADYALIVGGRILGVVEAKKLSVGPQNVLVQAGRYAKGIVQDGLSFGAYSVPFLYGTNGQVVWFHDARHDLNVSRELAAFHTPEALVELSGRDLDARLARLSALPNGSPWLRPYR